MVHVKREDVGSMFNVRIKKCSKSQSLFKWWYIGHVGEAFVVKVSLHNGKLALLVQGGEHHGKRILASDAERVLEDSVKATVAGDLL